MTVESYIFLRVKDKAAQYSMFVGFISLFSCKKGERDFFRICCLFYNAVDRQKNGQTNKQADIRKGPQKEKKDAVTVTWEEKDKGSRNSILISGNQRSFTTYTNKEVTKDKISTSIL